MTIQLGKLNDYINLDRKTKAHTHLILGMVESENKIKSKSIQFIAINKITNICYDTIVKQMIRQ